MTLEKLLVQILFHQHLNILTLVIGHVETLVRLNLIDYLVNARAVNETIASKIAADQPLWIRVQNIGHCVSAGLVGTRRPLQVVADRTGRNSRPFGQFFLVKACLEHQLVQAHLKDRPNHRQDLPVPE